MNEKEKINRVKGLVRKHFFSHCILRSPCPDLFLSDHNSVNPSSSSLLNFKKTETCLRRARDLLSFFSFFSN